MNYVALAPTLTERSRRRVGGRRDARAALGATDFAGSWRANEQPYRRRAGLSGELGEPPRPLVALTAHALRSAAPRRPKHVSSSLDQHNAPGERCELTIGAGEIRLDSGSFSRTYAPECSSTTAR